MRAEYVFHEVAVVNAVYRLDGTNILPQRPATVEYVDIGVELNILYPKVGTDDTFVKYNEIKFQQLEKT